MLAVWYDRQGPAGDVLQVGQLPEQEPGPREVRVRVRTPAIGDTKKRRGWLGSSMPYPRVIPHSDAAGVLDAVGEGVAGDRVGRRVWVYGAQSYRPFGTAAQYTVIPQELAVDLPDDVPDDVGACLGIPGITAHRAVFGDGPIAGATLLVHGVLGGVGGLAAQLARWGAATVIGTVRSSNDLIGGGFAGGRPRCPAQTGLIPLPTSGPSRRTASTGSSRSPFRTMPISTPPWARPVRSSPHTPAGKTDPTFPFWPCSSAT